MHNSKDCTNIIIINKKMSHSTTQITEVEKKRMIMFWIKDLTFKLTHPPYKNYQSTPIDPYLTHFLIHLYIWIFRCFYNSVLILFPIPHTFELRISKILLINTLKTPKSMGHTGKKEYDTFPPMWVLCRRVTCRNYYIWQDCTFRHELIIVNLFLCIMGL